MKTGIKKPGNRESPDTKIPEHQAQFMHSGSQQQKERRERGKWREGGGLWRGNGARKGDLAG